MKNSHILKESDRYTNIIYVVEYMWYFFQHLAPKIYIFFKKFMYHFTNYFCC